MLSNEYETIQYKVQYEDNNESCYSHVNSHQGGNSNSETMEIRSRKEKNDLDDSARAMIAAVSNSSQEGNKNKKKEVLKEPEILQPPAPVEEDKKDAPQTQNQKKAPAGKRRFTVEAEELLGQSID